MNEFDEGLRDFWDQCLDLAEDYLPIIYEDWCSDELDYKHIPLKVDSSLEFTYTTGEVSINRQGEVLSIVFNPIIFTKSDSELYSAILHEICHIAALETDLKNGNFDFDKYKACNCHNETWQKYADIFNNITNKKGEKKFNIIKSYSKEEYLKGGDDMKKAVHSKKPTEDKMRESLVDHSNLSFESEEDQKDYDSQMAIVEEAKRIGHKIIDDAIFQMAKAAEQFPDAIDGDPIWLLGSHLYGIEHADKLFEAYKAAKEALDNEETSEN